MRLTDINVRAIEGSDTYKTFFDDSLPAFGVRVGKRSKTFVVVRGRKRERISIGRYPEISLADARREAKRLLSEEHTEPKPKPKSFREARDEFLEQHYKGNTSRWPHLVKLKLIKHFKSLEHTQLIAITDGDIRAVLDKLADTPSTQLHVYRAIRTMLTWCTRPPRRYIRHSPMDGYAPPSTDKKGTRTLTDAELKAVWNASKTGSRAILRLLVLWGTRNEETCVICRKWAVDGVLTIPGEHTKNGRDHSIPLLPLAQSVLDARKERGQYYFPGRYSDDSHMKPGSLNRILREVQKDTKTNGWTLRDIRRTFRSNMARLKVPRDLCELLINHAPPILDEIYNKYSYLEEKREALAKYEAFVLNLVGSGESV